MKYLAHTLLRPAERQVRSAAAVSALLGLLSLWAALATWRERRHLDLELLLGLLDALLVLALAYALARRVTLAAWTLLALASLSAAYTLWLGRPVYAALPQVVSGILLVRAIRALRVLRRSAAEAPDQSGSRVSVDG